MIIGDDLLVDQPSDSGYDLPGLLLMKSSGSDLAGNKELKDNKVARCCISGKIMSHPHEMEILSCISTIE